MQLRVKLKEVLQESNMTQLELARLTGLRQAVVSELVNNQRLNINKSHITKICVALDIKDIRDILELIEDWGGGFNVNS